MMISTRLLKASVNLYIFYHHIISLITHSLKLNGISFDLKVTLIPFSIKKHNVSIHIKPFEMTLYNG